jgi:hypothetical protein
MMGELRVIDPKVEEAFHMMWGNFPAPVRLIHKNKTVLAVNVAAKKMGLNPGEHCFKVGIPAQHKGCKAHEALASNQGTQAINAEKDTIRFWLPIEGCPDVYVHLTLKLSTILDCPAGV